MKIRNLGKTLAMKWLLLHSALMISIIACKKHVEPVNGGTNQQQKKEVRIKACDCGKEITEYIKAEFNGISMCFGLKWTDNNPFTNVHIYNPEGQQDQLNLIRQNDDRSFTASFFFTNTRIHQRAIPYRLPHPNLEFCERAEFQLLDHTSVNVSQCQFCPGDDTDYIMATEGPLTIIIDDTKNDFLKGTFQGVMSTKTGNVLQVTNGVFNIKISRVSKL